MLMATMFHAYLNTIFKFFTKFLYFSTSSCMKMTICHLLIINEECVNFNNKCHIWILRPKFSAPKLAIRPIFTFFFTSSCMKMTICHLLIINEECINFNNECHIWILHPKISHPTHYYVSPTSSCTKMTIWHHTILEFPTPKLPAPPICKSIRFLFIIL